MLPLLLSFDAFLHYPLLQANETRDPVMRDRQTRHWVTDVTGESMRQKFLMNSSSDRPTQTHRLTERLPVKEKKNGSNQGTGSNQKDGLAISERLRFIPCALFSPSTLLIFLNVISFINRQQQIRVLF